MTVLYFAYGSNLHPLRLGRRVSSAELVAVGVLKARSLAFHKRSWVDGSGKCDVPVGLPSETVHGALYRISRDERPELARIEGVGAGYEVCRVEVETAAGQIDAYLFLAQPDFIDPSLRPFDWYKALVIAGSVFHRFPTDYTAAIEAVPTISDPDQDRARKNRELLEMIYSGSS